MYTEDPDHNPTRVAKTCRWSLCNKNTFTDPSAFVGLTNKLYEYNKCVEHGTYQTIILFDRN